MFGFQTSENAETVQRKKSYVLDARRKWPFLTNFDCSSVHTEGQLCSLVVARSGMPRDAAIKDIRAWMLDKEF
jgi:hypothetical protein